MQGFPRSLGGRPALALVLLGALSACRTIEIRRPIHATGEVRVGMPARAWEVVHEGAKAVGMVVLFEGREPERPPRQWQCPPVAKTQVLFDRCDLTFSSVFRTLL